MRSLQPLARWMGRPMARRGVAVGARVLGFALAAGVGLGGCDPLVLLGNECRSQFDCEGAALCIDEVCVAQCRLDSECGDAGPTAVCRFNRCTVPVVFVDANLSEAGPGDLSVDAGSDAAPDRSVRDQSPPDVEVVDAVVPDQGADLGADSGADAVVDLGADATLDAGVADANLDASDLGVDLGVNDAATDLQGDVIVPLLDVGP
jgi:hypothetical protein